MRKEFGDLMGASSKWFDRKSKTIKPQPGLYHYRREGNGGKARIHLRINEDDHGTLIVNANRIMHLNPTAALMAYSILEGKEEEQIINTIKSHYRIGTSQVRADLSSFNLQLDALIHPNGACPIHDLGFETVAPFSLRPSAPYRMDLALTYRCNNNCAHCYNVEGRILPELSTDDWKHILDKTWELGIPHVVFTGGEPTLREDLLELIAHAEKNGQITGLNTNARRLSEALYVDRLIESGLDHVQITLESCEPEIHDHMVRSKGAFQQSIKGLKNVLSTALYTMTNTTMLQENVHSIPATLDYLAESGVPTIGLNSLIYSGRGCTVGTGLPESDLPSILEVARQKTEAHNQQLIWYTPTQYCRFDPVIMNLGVKGCTAALYNMCVEPDGNVIPCQSYYQPLGSLLNDDWDSIWNHELAVRLRERQDLPEKCTGCELLPDCGAGCPLQFESIKMMTTLSE